MAVYLSLVLFVCFGVCHCKIADIIKEREWDEHHEGHSDGSHHEEILEQEEEEAMLDDESLTPTERRKKLTALFHKIDANGDFVIKHDELVQWLSKTIYKLDVEGTRGIFEKRDAIMTNAADGLVVWDEYVLEAYGHSVEEMEAWETNPVLSKEDTTKLLKNLEFDQKKFRMADVNKDGALSLDEHVAFVQPYDYKHMTQSEVNTFYSEFDKNEDGWISLDEYSGGQSSAGFNAFDLNKDGFLDNTELIKMLEPDTGDLAEAEANNLFDQCDEDQDGRLTLREVLEEQELWMGSEATGMGFFFEHDEL